MEEYWYNTETKQVEVGRQSPWTKLIGPYPTYEAAQHALETAHERSEAWDEQEREWREK
ncbi:SPOR domain-containing protein [Isoptericola sp. b441]|uniref:SPOR domain-containing protein n=1 Tax=Actinotalea lenta TaxID=3064654 RepID=A0ABT9DB09_9CELL|nr:MULTISPECIES: SPOR domain-containing protein [unclassified Isoptericola]MDO8108046.1 SPOR domain-containing protein [Isoptericola sp. b441]MDO8120285.1 SPOR domain-containing protein [Isoptericola sp. b490]